MEKKFTVSMNLDNIGPHSGTDKLSYSEEVNSNKTIFYAVNGTGKSFISRTFRLCTPIKNDVIVDDLLTIGEKEGHFSFEIENKEIDKKVEVSIKRGEPPRVNNSSCLLFHVFNSDYVEENLKAKRYSLDGKIEGYILGKVQIDLSEEKKEAEALEREIGKNSERIDNAINEVKLFLKRKGVTTNTKEFVAITREQLQNGFDYKQIASVDECIRQLKRLEKVPENLSDIQFPITSIDTSFLSQLKDMLKETYPKSEWDERFVAEYKENQSFIEAGLDHGYSDIICPFCKRTYDDEALKLISEYNQYRNDQEAQIVSKLRNMLQAVAQMDKDLDYEQKKILEAEMQLSEIKKYYPSLVEISLKKLMRTEEYKEVFQLLSETISQKIDNLNAPLEMVDKTIEECRQAWAEISTVQSKNYALVQKINKKKNDERAERLSLRRNLCKAKSLELQNVLKNDFKVQKEMRERLSSVQDEILLQEQQARVSKRDKVYETFEFCLDQFFKGKYQIDKESFQIKFKGTVVGDNASRILSDGEKSIVAFCWYLAETHTIINSEDDYNKLFFIIDDPISSMDFHFVYIVAQIIRDIKSIFGIPDSERIWVFTHNTEFFSIIMRNHILTNAYIIKPGLIKRFDHKLLLPYEYHLMDLVEIANRKKEPNHTTGNSIRHVIETISKFEDPDISIETFVNSRSVLAEDACIYSLCQDLSHGNVRIQPPFSDDVLCEAAKTVIGFIKAEYPGQLKSVMKRL